MAALDEIFELEKRVSEASEVLLKKKGFLPRLKREAQRVRDVVVAERTALNVAEANLRHMQGAADHVVLSEFVEVRKIAKAKQEALEEAQAELAKAENAVFVTERQIPMIEAVITDSRNALKGYGQLRQFKK